MSGFKQPSNLFFFQVFGFPNGGMIGAHIDCSEDFKREGSEVKKWALHIHTLDTEQRSCLFEPKAEVAKTYNPLDNKRPPAL